MRGLAIDIGEGRALTLEDMYAAIQAIEKQPTAQPHRHMVSPAGMKRLSEGGRTCCHSCGMMLEGSEAQ